ncbi:MULTISPECIES: hypothetical protein [Halolamina]|uniref:Uncharacterized protein n=1 Tax=Halolamina pelagica TaxID=699431 RepID=A0A1I5U8R3_9EURY|nr:MULTISPECIES: hypothetical protein [Halolamina]NHX37182.1 hypothetical protein [Halolamina sp. R1-12]SFP91608.1 hypothetical protein SAMN05216277_1128 [Halolamina pelagica]
MATSQDDWEVERIGPPGDKVEMELGSDGDTDLVRLHRGGETVTFRVENEIAEPVGDVPEWAEAIAHRLGVDRVKQR